MVGKLFSLKLAETKFVASIIFVSNISTLMLSNEMDNPIDKMIRSFWWG